MVNVVNAWSFVCLDGGRLVVCPSRSVPFWVRFAFSKFVDSNLSFSFAISCAREKGTPPRHTIFDKTENYYIYPLKIKTFYIST